MAMSRPAPNREKLLRFIKAEIAAGRPFPSKRALAEHMGWKNQSSAADALWALVRVGHLDVDTYGRGAKFSLPDRKRV